MVCGFGRGSGGRGGVGLGFRGSSPPWPYVGRGRGGLPRCWYPGLWTGAPYAPASYPAYDGPRGMPYTPLLMPEQELEFLKSQAEAIKAELNRVEAGIRDLQANR